MKGSYLNPGGTLFSRSRNSEIYVDKSLCIAETNRLINSEQRFLCISFPRRFGKSMNLQMLAAYYGCGEDSHALFSDLKIAQHPYFEQHIGKYNVVRIDIQSFLADSSGVPDVIATIKRFITLEIKKQYPAVQLVDESKFIQVMNDVYEQTGREFVVLIDEWDCIFREFTTDVEAQKLYLEFLKGWFKGQEYIAMVYMTGILPVKKYGTHSALNMFTEFSMLEPKQLAPFFGFTEEEVQALCQRYEMNFDEVKAWYDGYELRMPTRSISVYTPKSVVEAMMSRFLAPYWNRTETYDALKMYIRMNLSGLRDDVVRLLAGQPVCVKTDKFENDMVTFHSKDDVLTLLVHLGYLNYNQLQGTVVIPNKEIRREYTNCIEDLHWDEVTRAVQSSSDLLEALWAADEEAVASGIDRAHREISILTYNSENSLACALGLAFYVAREYYLIVREFPAGKGFADLVFIPRPNHADKPACVLELKFDKTVEGAIAQIQERGYCTALEGYNGKIIAAAINYDKSTKQHSAHIYEISRWK